MAEGLRVRDVRFAVGAKEILRGVSLDAAPGETVALIGPSGCGKTTLLRVVAGLERPASGTVCMNGEDVTGVPAHRRGFGLMFQEHALFPHMNVGRNIEFGLRQAKVPGDELLRSVGLEGFGDRTLEGLSGGERQRVALARTLAPSPRLLMLDEPLGSLDRGLRERLVVELREMLSHLEIPALYVTHDQFEAFAIADRLAIMREGQVVRDGAPADVFANPRTEFVARFLGLENLVRGHRNSAGLVSTPGGVFGPVDAGGTEVTLLLRSEGARLVDGPGQNVVHGKVEARLFQGPLTRLVVRAGGQELSFAFDSAMDVPAKGEDVHVALADIQALNPDA
jgi:ABC-type Fe3+/spermidine/putrescine transport system ATPase subunit